jgi:hypothetical protein
MALGTWHLALGTWHLALGTWHLTLGTWHLALGTWHLALVTWHFALGLGTWNFLWHFLLVFTLAGGRVTKKNGTDYLNDNRRYVNG